MTGDDAHRSFRGIGGVTIEPLSCAIDDLRITLDAPARRLDPAARQRLDEFWAREAARNPRLFDGPVLSCVEIDAPGATIRCRRATYRELICQPTVETGVMQLSVTGVCLVKDAAGVDHVLLGRRGEQTRVYGGMWELAPSGGMDHPARASSDGEEPMTGRDAWRQLMVEVEEELLFSDPAEGFVPSDPTCLCVDHAARSVDVVFPVRMPNEGCKQELTGATAGGWEYTGTRWIPVDELREFDATHASSIIAPTRAILRWMGWV